MNEAGHRVAGLPSVRLLDARDAGVDESAFRSWVRVHAHAAPARCISRSYSYPYAMIAWHSRPVGVDIERIEACDAAFADLICTPAERSEWGTSDDGDAYLTSLWSAKEALSKALGDAISYEPHRLESPLRWPAGRAGRWQARELPAPDGHVAWICWQPADDRGTAAEPAQVAAGVCV